MKAIVAKLIADRLGITPRTVLAFREENGRLVAEKAVMADPVTKVMGCLKLRKPPPV